MNMVNRDRTLDLMFWVMVALLVMVNLEDIYKALTGPETYEAITPMLAFNSASMGGTAVGLLALNMYYARKGAYEAFGFRHIGRMASALLLILVPVFYGLCKLTWFAGGPSWTSALSSLFLLLETGMIAVSFHVTRENSLHDQMNGRNNA